MSTTMEIRPIALRHYFKKMMFMARNHDKCWKKRHLQDKNVIDWDCEVSYCLKTVCGKQIVLQLKQPVTDDLCFREKSTDF